MVLGGNGDSKLQKEDIELRLRSESVICLLVINQIKSLPELAVLNILEHSAKLVVVGYIDEEDIKGLPSDERILYVRIPTKNIDFNPSDSKEYLPFDKQIFFVLVAYKWELFKMLFEYGVSQVIYSDLDVIWFADMSEILSNAHRLIPSVKVFIQSATVDPSRPQLCMGLISMLNSPEVTRMVSDCFEEHYSKAISGEKIGDDDVITNYYLKHHDTAWIRELPQSTFPVGMFVNLLNRTSSFPGLVSVRPLMFHANFVVGLRNKLLLLKIAGSLINGRNKYSQLTAEQRLRLFLKSARQFRRNLFA